MPLLPPVASLLAARGSDLADEVLGACSCQPVLAATSGCWWPGPD